MSRNSWTMYIKGSGDVWNEDGNISVPNEDVTLGRTSTAKRQPLANGDFALVTPETKYNRDGIDWRWVADDGTIKTKIEGYINDDELVKIEDSNSNTYIGKFTNIRSNWMRGVSPDEYDIIVSFEFS